MKQMYDLILLNGNTFKKAMNFKKRVSVILRTL